MPEIESWKDWLNIPGEWLVWPMRQAFKTSAMKASDQMQAPDHVKLPDVESLRSTMLWNAQMLKTQEEEGCGVSCFWRDANGEEHLIRLPPIPKPTPEEAAEGLLRYLKRVEAGETPDRRPVPPTYQMPPPGG